MISQEDQSQLAAIRAAMIDTDPLYVNFTSGSTGLPKGVLVSHRSVLDFIDVFTDAFSFTQTDRIGNQAPFDFDVSVKDIYGALKAQATLVIIPRRLFSRPKELLDFLCEHKVTTLVWAVSALCLISTFHGLDYRTPDTVSKVLFSGEVMPLKHLKTWMEHLPKAQFVNLYGPTEITCNCTHHILDRERDYQGGIPIGRPFPNEEVFLLDGEDRRSMRPVRWESCAYGVRRWPLATTARPSRRRPPLCLTPATPLTPSSSTAPATWAGIPRTENLCTVDARTFRLSTWATGWSWRRSSGPCPPCRRWTAAAVSTRRSGRRSTPSMWAG